ncbi:BED zinc finger [Popillia japonica]|uniref:BED zinc finger n=1 Tax=Popillia japonica TaxID=7064 RepID=A0AAW1MDM9_POPJA
MCRIDADVLENNISNVTAHFSKHERILNSNIPIKDVDETNNGTTGMSQLSINQKTFDWINSSNFDVSSQHSNSEIVNDNKTELKGVGCDIENPNEELKHFETISNARTCNSSSVSYDPISNGLNEELKHFETISNARTCNSSSVSYDPISNGLNNHEGNLECSAPKNLTILQNVPIYPITKINDTEKTHYNYESSIISDSVSIYDGKESEVLEKVVFGYENGNSVSIYDGKESEVLEKVVFGYENENLQTLAPSHSQNEMENTDIHSEYIPCNVANNFESDDYKSDLDASGYNDDSRDDKDFNSAEYSSDTTSNSSGSGSINLASEINIRSELPSQSTFQSLFEEIKSKKKEPKKIRCKYCNEDIDTKNFNRHLQRKHSTEAEVKSVMQYPKNSKERKFTKKTFN